MDILPDSSQELRWLLQDKYEGIPPEPERLAEDLARLAKGEPLAYVIGWVNFLGARIEVNKDVLIPRPETEYWLEQVLATWPALPRGAWSAARSLQVLDLCCGSGCIGMAVLTHLPAAEVTFVDISSAAVAQTQRNLEVNKLVGSRAKVVQADLADFLVSGQTAQFDLILTNPPYVDPTGEFGNEIKWEPAQALFAQNHGLGLIDQILKLAPKKLKKGGKLVMEFGKGQEEAIEKKVKELNLTSYRFGKDQFGVTRYLVLMV